MGLARSSKVCLRLRHHSFRKADTGYRLEYDHHCGASTQYAGRPLARCEEQGEGGALHGDLQTPLHAQHRHRPHEGGRTAEDHGPARCRGGRLQEGVRRQRGRRRGHHPDRDAGDVRPVADGQGRCAVGPVRRRDREPRHRAASQGIRPEDHRPRAARLLRDDRDRPRQRRAGPGDHRDLRSLRRRSSSSTPPPAPRARTTSVEPPKPPGWQPFSRS